MKNKNVDYTQKVLEVKNLRQYFKVGSGKNKLMVKAVDGVSFDVYKREVFGLVGESGCGKTTTGRSIIKLYKPTDGEVIYKGNVVGAGYDGYLYDIRKLKKEAKIKIIENNPYKYQKFLINDDFSLKVEHLKQKTTIYDFETNKKRENILSRVIKHKEKYHEIKHAYEQDLSDLKFNFQQTVETLYSKSIKRVIDDRKNNIKLINNRANDKVKFIKQAKIEAHEKNEQIRIIEDNRKNEIEYIQNSTDKELRKILSLGEHDYIDLKEIRKTLVIKERKEIKKSIEKFKLEYNKNKVIIKESYNKKIQEYKEIIINKDALKKEARLLKLQIADKHYITKKEICDLKKLKKEKLLKLLQDFKLTNEAFVEDSNKKEQIIQELKAKIAEKKKLISKAKRENSFTEDKEHKQNRLNKLRLEKERFNKEKQTINQIEDLEVKKEKLQSLKLEHKQKMMEINATKPNHANYISSMQMIFQDPISSLNPRMIVGDIISEGLRIKGVRNKKEIQSKVFELLNLVGLNSEHASRYPHEFSGGQRQRIGIARSLIVNPDFIIADEPISALDVSIQAQVINLLNELKEKLGLTILFVAHDLSVVKYFSDRIAVMHFGKIVELANSDELFAHPLHPYTKSLLSAIPHPDPKHEKNRTRIIYDPRIHNYSTDRPTLREIKKGHFISANDEEYNKYLKELKGE